MRLLALWTGLVLSTLVAGQVVPPGYIPDPEDPTLLIPVRPDYTRARVRMRPNYVETPASPYGVWPLVALILFTPVLLFSGRNSGFLSGNGNGAGGGVFVDTEPTCC